MDPAAQQFIRDLRELHLRSGKPSYAILERLSQHKLKRATVSDILNGHRVNLPDWRFVSLFVEACRAAAREGGLDQATLGTLADWKKHWDSAGRGIIGARFPASGHEPSGQHAAEVAGQRAGAVEDITDGNPVDDEDLAEAALGAEVTAPAAPPVSGPLPSRLTEFAGREVWLSRLRRTLATPDRDTPVVIQGLCGIGKSQLAVEYAYRYAQEYELIWWISCADLDEVHDAMTALASELGRSVGPADEDDRYAQLFDALRVGQPYARWLLIFDGADDPEEIRDLIPPMIPPITSHVLITTRNSRWAASGDLLELDTFTREESVQFLLQQMHRVSPAEAHRLAEAVGDLPLVLEHAIEARIATDEYMARLRTDPLRLLEGQPVDYPATVAAQWRTAIARLRDNSPEALDLLRCLAFFGNEPVPRDWLERGGYVEGISIRQVLRVPLLLAGSIRTLRRAGLLRVRADVQTTLEVHQVTRRVIRSIVSKEDANLARHDVHLLLVAADPLDPDNPANWGDYDNMRAHAAHSSIEYCDDESVRTLVVNMTRSLTAAGNPRAAIGQADYVLRRWSAADSRTNRAPSGAIQTMRLAKAAALLACGQCHDAFRLHDETLSAIRAQAGEANARKVPLDSIAGAQFRISGRFADARAADRKSLREHAARFGREHPQTFIAVNGVIADLTLNGEYAAAGREATRAYTDSLAFHNESGYPAVLLQQNVLGRCEWLRGKYDQAADTIGGARARYDAIVANGRLSGDHPWRLANRTDHVVARRDSGTPGAELDDLANDMQDVRRRWWRTLGVDHPQTIAATVALASILLRIPGRDSAAIRLLTDAHGRYQSVLPDHPFAYACRGYLAMAQWKLLPLGPGGTDAPPLDAFEDVISQLVRSAGKDHPLTLAAILSLVNARASAGDLEAALESGRQVLARFQSRLGADHPHALACEANVATMSSWLLRDGGPRDPTDVRERYAKAVGPEHPNVRLFEDGGLIDIDFTPLPLFPL